MPRIHVISVTGHESHHRIDLFLAGRLPLSRSGIQRLIEEGMVLVNQKITKANYKIHPFDQIQITIPGPTPVPLEPEPIPLEILYEDPHLLVLHKPAGMVVHPAPGHDRGTLVNALLHHCRDLQGIGGRERPGLVHRLDKDTSGVLVVAKSDLTHEGLSKQFRNHTIQRTYLALVCGRLKQERGKIDLAIGRDTKDRKKISARTVRPRASVTEYQVIQRFSGATLVEVYPKTGRTHQIRVHFAHLHHPIAGDKTYGGSSAGQIGKIPVPRQMLHAQKLGFAHPVTGEVLSFSAPIPEDMAEVLRQLT
ncbi:MAG: RluA family pseudouridine synthase [Nitrospirae bacterium]|nr:RluA family pseudouridine synthase [Nitrospirota bacterium]